MFAERIGRLIARIGERRALTIEYVGLIAVFTAYAVVDNATLAAALYVIDHMFFALAIGMTTYFHRLQTSAISRVQRAFRSPSTTLPRWSFQPRSGSVWVQSHSAVFLVGTAFAVCSLVLARNVPDAPGPGNEVRIGTWGPLPSEGR